MSIKAIVYPVQTGRDWITCDPPIALERDSKAAALRALKKRGYRIMWRGGFYDVLSVTADELRDSRADTPDVMGREREIGFALPDGGEITKYVITVWPISLPQKNTSK